MKTSTRNQNELSGSPDSLPASLGPRGRWGVSLAPSSCDRNSCSQGWVRTRGSFVLRDTWAPQGRGGMEIVKRSPSWVCLQPSSRPGALRTAGFQQRILETCPQRVCPHRPVYREGCGASIPGARGRAGQREAGPCQGFCLLHY